MSTSNPTSPKWVPVPDDVVSEESDFYGDAETRASYSRRADQYDPEKYWAVHRWNVQVRAAEGRKKAKEYQTLSTKGSKTPGGEGRSTTTPSNFFIRLPHLENSSTPYTEIIYEVSKYSEETINSTLPSQIYEPVGQRVQIRLYPGYVDTHNTSRVDRFLSEAKAVLHAFRQGPGDVDSEVEGESLPRNIPENTTQLRKRIFSLAWGHGIRGGKWIFYTPKSWADKAWRTTVEGTLGGKLGVEASFIIQAEDSQDHVIFGVHTKDWEDEYDVASVLKHLYDTDLIHHEQDLYYKTDAFSLLGLRYGNEYGIHTISYSGRTLRKKWAKELEF